MSVLQQYKCPCCDGAIEFDGAAQAMRCPYCDNEFDIQTLVSYDQEVKTQGQDQMNWQEPAQNQWQPGETNGMLVYQCQSCGGEVVGDQTTGATACPFCGNPVVITGFFSGDLKPDFVIPFATDKKAALEALKKHYGGKKLLPKVFTEQNHIEEVKGVYVPVWLFDTYAAANIRYKATRVRHWSDSQYNYTETSHFAVRRGGHIGFSRVPVDGSTKMDDTLMESIEPFDCSKAVTFHTAYLSGFLADKYDVDAQESIQRANERIKHSTEEAFASTVQGFSTVVPVNTSMQLHNGSMKYALYPVWLLSTSWEGKNYIFAMNGQTGKFAGDLPMDKSAYMKWLLAILGIGTAASFLLSWLLWLL